MEHPRREIPAVGNFIGGFGAIGGGGAAAVAGARAPVNYDMQAILGGGGGGLQMFNRHQSFYKPYNPPPIPTTYSLNWTHKSTKDSTLIQKQAGLRFSNQVIEPPLEVESYLEEENKEGDRVVTGELGENSMICCRCDEKLVMGGGIHDRLWSLNCGHVIDGKCLRQINGTEEKIREWEEKEEVRRLEREEEKKLLVEIEEEKAESKVREETFKLDLQQGKGKGKGKGKERDILEINDSDDDDDELQSTRRSKRLKSNETSKSNSRTLRNGKLLTSTMKKEAPQKVKSKVVRVAVVSPSPTSSQRSESQIAEERRKFVYCKNPDGWTKEMRGRRTFKCPVIGCGVKCCAEPGHESSAVELFC